MTIIWDSPVSKDEVGLFEIWWVRIVNIEHLFLEKPTGTREGLFFNQATGN